MITVQGIAIYLTIGHIVQLLEVHAFKSKGASYARVKYNCGSCGDDSKLFRTLVNETEPAFTARIGQALNKIHADHRHRNKRTRDDDGAGAGCGAGEHEEEEEPATKDGTADGAGAGADTEKAGISEHEFLRKLKIIRREAAALQQQTKRKTAQLEKENAVLRKGLSAMKAAETVRRARESKPFDSDNVTPFTNDTAGRKAKSRAVKELEGVDGDRSQRRGGRGRDSRRERENDET